MLCESHTLYVILGFERKRANITLELLGKNHTQHSLQMHDLYRENESRSGNNAKLLSFNHNEYCCLCRLKQWSIDRLLLWDCRMLAGLVVVAVDAYSPNLAIFENSGLLVGLISRSILHNTRYVSFPAPPSTSPPWMICTHAQHTDS